MQKLRQFRDLFLRLKAVEIAGAQRVFGRFGQWLLTVPGAILGVLVALFWSIVGVVAAAPGFVKGLLFKAPNAIVVVLAAIGMVLVSVLLFIWWWVVPGVATLGVVIGPSYVIFGLAAVWWLKIIVIIGILAAFVVYWNILAAAMGVWGDGHAGDLTACLGEALNRMWKSYLVEAVVLLAVILLVVDPLLFFIILGSLYVLVVVVLLIGSIVLE